MAQSPKVVVDLAEKMLADLRRSRMEEERIGKTKRYLDGDHNLPTAPGKDRRQHTDVARKSIDNWLPLVSSTYTQGLFVDGFRAARQSENASPWRIWQANGMDARQTIPTRGALDYGVAYGLTLPGTAGVPAMKALDPLRSTAWYEDDDDEWPVLGLYEKGRTVDGKPLLLSLDDEFVYTMTEDDGRLHVHGVDAHRLGVTPMTRFRTRLGGESVGVIWPLIPAQDRINETVFALMMALRYASFRQRHASGLEIKFDEEGNPIAPFDAGADLLWVTNNPEAKFGDFAQTEVSGHISAHSTFIRTLAARAQVSPNILTGDLANLSADALAQLRDATRRQTSEFRTLMGESWEQWLRLSAKAAGDLTAARDLSSEVRWRSDEPESFGAKVDALGKMVSLLGVPAEAVWELVPDVTDGDIARWKAAASQPDAMTLLTETLLRQEAPSAGALAAQQAPAA